ncbi:MAG: hypothetical protein ACLR7Z_16875 [Bilophila wadsworthia]
MARDALYHRRRVRDLRSRLEQVQAVAQRSLRTKPWTLPDAPDMDMTPVRINISLPKCVLEGWTARPAPGNDPLGAHRQGCTGVYVTG